MHRRAPLLLPLALCAGAHAAPPAVDPAPAARPAPTAADAGRLDDVASFVVSDIRVEGLQRIGAGTVFTYLPIERGDVADTGRIREAIRALYKSGFFEDVRAGREGDAVREAGASTPRGILVITVVERPSINTLKIEGNKDIKTEDLLKNLADIGIGEGETFDRLALSRVTLELDRAYHNRGKYNVEIVPEVSRLDRNRVDVAITIHEGKAARIRHINLVGNAKYTEDELRAHWESNESNWLSWYRRDDQYSSEKLSGDLERTTEFYLDRGYVDASIDSTQVALGPDKRDVYITASLSEGDIYAYDDVRIVGDSVLSKAQIERYLLVRKGQTFSRTLLELSSDSIVAALGNVGYAFARVEPIPHIDRDRRTVGIDFQVTPGPRVTVRRIAFKGNARTTDEVLRREMRQFEGAWYSQAAIDRSKSRLQQLGFFETGSVAIEAVPVPGTNDRVDLAVTLKETSSGQFQVGFGYQQENGLTVNFQLSQQNFLGTGRGLSFNVARNSSVRQFGFSVTDPYLTDEGIGLGYSVSTATTRQSSDDDNSYDSDQARLGVTATMPLSETNTLSLTASWQTQTLYLTDGYYPQSTIDYLDALGSDRIRTFQLAANWGRDTRNDFLAPTAGAFQNLNLQLALPGSSARYYKLDYRYGRYFNAGPLNLYAHAELGYGDSYGDATTRLECQGQGSHPHPRPQSVAGAAKAYTDADCGPGATLQRVLVADGLPFYERFYAGGARSVRTFRDNALGPCEYVSAYKDCRPTGGALKTVGGLELSMPRLFAGNGTRIAFFTDVGNVFGGVGAFDSGELRASAGLSMLWRSPMGPISISYGVPLLKQAGDDVERLQFGFGGQF